MSELILTISRSFPVGQSKKGIPDRMAKEKTGFVMNQKTFTEAGAGFSLVFFCLFLQTEVFQRRREGGNKGYEGKKRIARVKLMKTLYVTLESLDFILQARTN